MDSRAEADLAREELPQITAIFETVTKPTDKSDLDYENDLIEKRKQIDSFKTKVKDKYLESIDALLADFDRLFRKEGKFDHSLTREEAGAIRAFEYVKGMRITSFEERDNAVKMPVSYTHLLRSFVLQCGRFLLYGCGAFLHHIIKLTFLLLLSAAVFLLVKNTAVYPFKNKRLYLGLFCLARFFFAFLCGWLALAFGFVLDRCKMQIVRILLKFSEFRNAERIVKNALLYSHKALIPLCKITLCKIDVYTLRHICCLLYTSLLRKRGRIH